MVLCMSFSYGGTGGTGGVGIFGITSGASLAVALVVLLLGGSIATEILQLTGFLAILAAAFVGAMAVTAVLYFFSRIVQNHVMLLIIGLMVGYLSSSAVTLLSSLSTEEGVRSYVMWGMGTFGAVSLRHLPLFALGIVVGIGSAVVLVKPLNAMLLGDHYAQNLDRPALRRHHRLLRPHCLHRTRRSPHGTALAASRQPPPADARHAANGRGRRIGLQPDLFAADEWCPPATQRRHTVFRCARHHLHDSQTEIRFLMPFDLEKAKSMGDAFPTE